MDLDPSKVIESLTRIETQYKTIADTLHDIHVNLKLGDGSTLKDSVRRVISEDLSEQYKQCGIDMRTVAESTVRNAIDEHKKTYHKRDSKSPMSSGLNFEAVKPILIFLVKRILPLVLAGGATIGGMEILNTSQRNSSTVIVPISSTAAHDHSHDK